MKKILMAFILIFVTAFLTGCIKAEISYEIIDTTAVKTIYSIYIAEETYNKDIEQINGLLLDLKSYWETQNFDITKYCTLEDRYLVVQGERYSSLDNRIENIVDILADKNFSPFKDVKLAYKSLFLYDNYNIETTIDLRSILDKNHLSSLPPSMKNSINEFADENNFKISFTLPGGKNHTNADQIIELNGMTEYIWNVNLNEEKKLSYNINIKNSIMQNILVVLSILVILLPLAIVRDKKKSRDSGRSIQA